jgi:hypothetical protein
VIPAVSRSPLIDFRHSPNSWLFLNQVERASKEKQKQVYQPKAKAKSCGIKMEVGGGKF